MEILRTTNFWRLSRYLLEDAPFSQPLVNAFLVIETIAIGLLFLITNIDYFYRHSLNANKNDP